MADRTISVLIDHTASLNNAYLANQGEEISLDVTIPAGLVALALDGYIDFELPDGTAYFKGPFSCATGTISTTLGATDSILDASGKVHWQFVLAITTGSVRDVKWKSKQYDTEVLASIGATNAAILPYVPQMVFPVAYPAANISVADVSGLFVGTDAEAVLTELYNKKINLAGGSANPFTAMPYVGTSPIVASGAGYVKYADGTMICWGSSILTSTSNASGSIFYSAELILGFPAAFYVAPSLITSAYGTDGVIIGSRGYGSAVGGAKALLIGSQATNSGYVNWLAIGRWKA